MKLSVVAGDDDQLAKVCWLPCRILLCMKSDVELRAHMVEVAMKDGLLGPHVPVNQTAAAWVRLWLSASQLEKDAVMLTLNQRTRAQVGTWVCLQEGGQALVLQHQADVKTSKASM